MCASPVLAPHGRPAPPAPAARPSHYQSQPLVYSRRDARAAAHLTSTPAPFCALCRLGTLPLASHKRLYQDAPRVRRRSGTAQARTHARTRARSSAQSAVHSMSACLHTQHTAPCARIRLTMQPALHNNSLPHASPRRPALTPPAARSEKLQRAPLPTPAVSLHSETFSIHPAAAPPRAHSHRSNEEVSRSMGYRPSPRLPHAVPFLFTAISIKRKTRWRKFLSSC